MARLRGNPKPPGDDGTGTCYIEFGDRGGGRVDVDFFSTPGTRSTSTQPSATTPRRRRHSPRAAGLAGSAADPDRSRMYWVVPPRPTVVLPRAHDRRVVGTVRAWTPPTWDALSVEGLRKTFDATDDEQVPVRARRGLDLAGRTAPSRPSWARPAAEIDPPQPRRRPRDPDGPAHHDRRRGDRRLIRRRARGDAPASHRSGVPVLQPARRHERAENVSPPMVVAGRGRKQADSRAMDLLDLSGIADKARRSPGVLCGGSANGPRSLARSPTSEPCRRPTSRPDRSIPRAAPRSLGCSDGCTKEDRRS